VWTRTLRGGEWVGESPFWPTAAIVASAVLYADLPAKFISGGSAGVFAWVRWLVPALTALVLAALVVSVPGGRIMERFGWRGRQLHVTRRWLTLAVIAVVSAANMASIVLLIHLLVNGAHATASSLLRAAVHMWIVNVLLFGLWYWQLDGGGPVVRPRTTLAERDFLFPQQTDQTVFGVEWSPLFLDYLFVSYTNASAFSPTDTMPLSRWAKMLMLVQSAISLSLAVMVVARAVNILQ
jgi:hypothetical protein